VREPDRLLLIAVEADRSAGEALLGPDAFRRWRRVLRGWLSGRLRIVVCNQRRGTAGRAEQRDTDHEERNEASCHFGMPQCLMSRGTSLPTARSRSAYAFSKSASAWKSSRWTDSMARKLSMRERKSTRPVSYPICDARRACSACGMWVDRNRSRCKSAVFA